VGAGLFSPREIRGSDLPLLSSRPGLAGRPLIHRELQSPGGGAGSPSGRNGDSLMESMESLVD
jgi:hypothetical protein